MSHAPLVGQQFICQHSTYLKKNNTSWKKPNSQIRNALNLDVSVICFGSNHHFPISEGLHQKNFKARGNTSQCLPFLPSSFSEKKCVSPVVVYFSKTADFPLPCFWEIKRCFSLKTLTNSLNIGPLKAVSKKEGDIFFQAPIFSAWPGLPDCR